jgi:hypothetical protein
MRLSARSWIPFVTGHRRKGSIGWKCHAPMSAALVGYFLTIDTGDGSVDAVDEVDEKTNERCPGAQCRSCKVCEDSRKGEMLLGGL